MTRIADRIGAACIAACIVIALCAGCTVTHYTVNITQVTPAQGDTQECMTDAECEDLDDTDHDGELTAAAFI